MLNRVAETLYWIGRYVERAEDTARILDVQFHTDVEQGVPGSHQTWQALLRATASPESPPESSDRGVVEHLMLSRGNPSSVLSCLERARDNARTVRERVSREFWEELNAAYLELRAADAGAVLANLGAYCRRIRNAAHLVIGLADATLLHDDGLYWLKSGLFLERADMTTRFIDAKGRLLLPDAPTPPSLAHFQWTAVLKSVSGWEAYRKVDVGGISGRAIIDFLLFDAQFPRSVRYALGVSAHQFELAAARTPAARRAPVLRLYADVANKVRYDNGDEVLRAGLHPYLDDLQQRFGAISETMRTWMFEYLPERV
jgi:uncharacterized alpha-E superfamily protein